MRADSLATGAHSVFRRCPKTGRISHYETFFPQTNPRNPNPWQSTLRFDSIGKSHRNKILKLEIETPHIHDPSFPGGVRYPELWEVPK